MPQRGEGLGPLGESQSLSWGPLRSLRCSAFSCWVDFVEFTSQLSFVSPSVATTPRGFLASSFSWMQSPWSECPGRVWPPLSLHPLGHGGGGPRHRSKGGSSQMER